MAERAVNPGVERTLQVVVLALVVTTTLLVGLGRRTLVVSLLALAAASAALVWTDICQRFHLPRMAANLLALGAVSVAFLATRGADSLDQLLAVAELQAFLQLVLLFQEKTTRLYGQVIALSIGQAVVGATVTAGLAFGVLLLVVAYLAVLAGILTLLRRETLAVDPRPLLPLRDGRGEGAAPINHFLQDSAAAPAAVGPCPRRALIVRLPWRAAGLIAASLAIAAVVFLLVPRMSGRRWQPGESTLRVVGFSRTVKLGALGEMVENPDVVLRASFFRGRSDRPYPISGPVLFRGVVLDRYARGVWTQSSQFDDLVVPPRVPRDENDFVRQEVSIEGLDVPVLFGVYPLRAIRTQAGVLYDYTREQYLRDDESREHRFDYSLAALGFRAGKLAPLAPQARKLDDEARATLLELPAAEPPDQSDPLAGLKAQARQLLDDGAIDPATSPLAAAQALNAYLHASGVFQTSGLRQERAAGVDPLEDFVTTNRRGHCEYFAGALAMMLRSVGIPARVVIGFKNGQWNPVGGYYQVKQLHAHAWVEAHLEPEACIGEPGADEVRAAGGGWLVLDPTAGSDADSLAAASGPWWSGIQDLAQETWTLYVVGLNAQRQQDAIYRPIADLAHGTLGRLVDPSAWHGALQAWGDSPPARAARWLVGNWSRPIGLAAWAGAIAVAGFLVVGLWNVVRGLVAVMRRARRHRRRRSRAPGEWILARLEKALARLDLSRERGQTPREFAVLAGGELAESRTYQRLAPLPRRIVDVFYRVRFGRAQLAGAERASLEAVLRELERGLAAS